MLGGEPFAKLRHDPALGLLALGVTGSQKFGEAVPGCPINSRVTVKEATPEPGSSNLKSRKIFSQVVSNPRAPVFSPAACCGDFAQRLVLEEDFDAIGAEGSFVLPDDAAFGPLEDVK